MVARIEDGLRSPFEREPELIALIGQAIVVWGAINHLMRTIGMQVFDCDYAEADRLLAKCPGEGARLALLIEKLPDGERDGLKDVLTKLKDATQTRNRIVHGGPLYGFRAGLFERGMHIVNFQEANPEKRFHEAAPYVIAHLEVIRALGADLFDHAHGTGALGQLDEMMRYPGPPEPVDA
jgi:hypothetical protein